MKENQEVQEKHEEDTKLKDRKARKIAKKAIFINKMEASNTAQKMFIWLRYKWLDSILFLVSLLFTGVILIVIGKILWEVAKVIFSISL